MKRSGDYYVTVVEDTNLGQIVATATLVIEHKFTHSCAKVYPLPAAVVRKKDPVPRIRARYFHGVNLKYLLLSQ